MASFVAALPSPYREALVLTELQGMPHKDAAQILGVSLPAMKGRVRRGRQQIQEMLEACCEIALDARGRVLSYDRRLQGPVPKDCCADGEACK
jgi:RNA polymerase sigma-70 factor (ECF subfamily)